MTNYCVTSFSTREKSTFERPLLRFPFSCLIRQSRFLLDSKLKHLADMFRDKGTHFIHTLWFSSG